jgi:ribosomal protein S18 acetylase RimI-like enzyme
MAADLAWLQGIAVEKFDAGRHDRSAFDCGVDRLNTFLKITVSKYVKEDNGQIYAAVKRESGRLAGFHAIGPHAIDVTDFENVTRKRFPKGWDRIPAFYLSMIGVDRFAQGKGLGTFLLGDVFARCLAVSEQIGGRFIVLDAINDKAAALYRRLGFEELTSHHGRMVISIAKVRRSAKEAARRAAELS